MKKFIVTIGKLWAGSEGATEADDFNQDLEFDPDEITIKAPVKGKMLIVKLKREVRAVLTDVSTTVQQTCEKCLNNYDIEINIPSAERSFYVEKPEGDADFNDQFLISMRDLTIDLYEMIRQEIILHFPLISVCSKSCKGLCGLCGANKNKKKCSCKEEDPTRQKPFKNLKKLIT